MRESYGEDRLPCGPWPPGKNRRHPAGGLVVFGCLGRGGVTAEPTAVARRDSIVPWVASRMQPPQSTRRSLTFAPAAARPAAAGWLASRPAGGRGLEAGDLRL